MTRGDWIKRINVEQESPRCRCGPQVKTPSSRSVLVGSRTWIATCEASSLL
jgi:hypothetical protein